MGGSRQARSRVLLDAGAVGVAGGMRTFAPWASMALRGRILRGPGRFPALGALGGELLADKHPEMPTRLRSLGLGFRLAGSGSVGFVLAGPVGAATAGAAAMASAHGASWLRVAIGERSGFPDPALGAAEDAIAISLALWATRDRR